MEMGGDSSRFIPSEQARIVGNEYAKPGGSIYRKYKEYGHRVLLRDGGDPGRYHFWGDDLDAVHYRDAQRTARTVYQLYYLGPICKD